MSKDEMATVRAFSAPGLKLWFYSNDHEPPHFHAKRTGQKVYFLEDADRMFEAQWQLSPPSAKVRKSWQRSPRSIEALLEEWEAVHQDS